MKNPAVKDRIVGIVCLLISALFAYNTFLISSRQLEGDPGPKLFPYIGCALTAICSIILIIKPDTKQKDALQLTAKEWKRMAVLFGVYILFIVLIWLFGFPAAMLTFAFIISILFAQDKSNLKKTILKGVVFAVALTAFLYLIYVLLFETSFPTGIVWEALGL